MKRFTALLLVAALLLSLAPAALAATCSLYFGASQVDYDMEKGVTLTLKAIKAPERDLEARFHDQRGNVYAVTFPAGKTELPILIRDTLPRDGSQTLFILDNNDGYVRRTPDACTAVPRGTASFAFASAIYQTFTGRDISCKIRVQNPGALAAGTRIYLVDERGRLVDTLEHNPSRTAWNLTYTTDESWMPGRYISIRVETRDTVEDTALFAVGNTGRKAIWGVDRADSKISFTMDCGSHNRYVPRILDILDQYNVKITFFVTGAFAAANPDLVREMAARGHEVGNHSWTHADFDTLDKEQIYSELSRTSDLLESLTGQPVTLFRPPYGHCSGITRSIVNALGMQAVRWTHESMDARSEASQANSLKYSTRNMQGGSIILTHTSAGCTVAVLDQILQWYQDNGFEVVPVSQLLPAGDTWLDEDGILHQN